MKSECPLNVLYVTMVFGTELLTIVHTQVQWAHWLVHNYVFFWKKDGNKGVSQKTCDASGMEHQRVSSHCTALY